MFVVQVYINSRVTFVLSSGFSSLPSLLRRLFSEFLSRLVNFKMFSKLSLLVLVAPLVSALTFGTLPPISSSSPTVITWTTEVGDASTATLELTHPDFNQAMALANNVDMSMGSINITIPTLIPGDGYTLIFVDNSDINTVYATSASFSISAASSGSGSAPSTTSSLADATTNKQSATGIVTTANSLPATISTAATPSSISSPTTGTGTGTAAPTTSSAAAVSSRFALTDAGSYAVLLLSAVAGAAAIAL